MSDKSEKNVPGKCWGCSTSPQLKLYQTFIFATPILFTLVLLLLFCLLYVRRRRSARAVSLRRPQFFARGLFSAPLEHGLNKSFRDNLPTIVYDDTFGETRDDNQCAVCLSDYVLNEKLQQLPICGHVFHLECIDEWLASNSTCPICRSSLLPYGKVVPIESPVHDSDVHINSGRENSADHQQHVPLAESSIGEIETSGTPKSHRSVSSMEDVVKESVEHVINIER